MLFPDLLFHHSSVMSQAQVCFSSVGSYGMVVLYRVDMKEFGKRRMKKDAFLVGGPCTEVSNDKAVFQPCLSKAVQPAAAASRSKSGAIFSVVQPAAHWYHCLEISCFLTGVPTTG